jgi:DNA-binding transcriptional MerR regulator
MLIGELSKCSGLSRDTIRYYEKRGLVGAPVRQDNNYKDYPEDSIQLLLFIKHLQGGGFTLSEVQTLLNQSDQKSLTCKQVEEIVRHKVDQIDQEIADLKASKEQLVNSFTSCDAKTLKDVCTPFRDKIAG